MNLNDVKLIDIEIISKGISSISGGIIMKKNIIKMRAYGFTLVELLATIVVIAVVSLITVPAVTAIIERTRKASFAKSAMNVNKISDNYYISDFF